MLDIGYMQHLIENGYDYHNTVLQVPSVGEMEIVAMNEATYYGKNKQLLEVEKILDEMCIEARAHGTGTTKFTAMMGEVGDKLAKVFGFKSLLINSSIMDYVIMGLEIGTGKLPSTITEPGYTYIHSSIYKYTVVALGNGKTAEVIVCDDKHKGVQFDPKFKYVMRMGIGPNLFMDRGVKSFTGGEILAIILHEIGHNFYIGPVKEFTADALSLMSFKDLSTIIKVMGIRLLAQDGVSVIDDAIPDQFHVVFRSIYNVISPILNIIEKISNIINIPTLLLAMPVKLALIAMSIPKNLPIAWLKYDSEKYSDAFATSFGYGAELSSALNKLIGVAIPGNTSKGLNDFVETIKYLIYFPIRVLVSAIDPHPNNMARLNNDIKYMEAAGKRKMSPALKKEYDKALQDMYELRDAYANTNSFNLYEFDNSFHLWLQRITRVTDIKDLASTFNIFKSYKNLDFD